MAHDFTTIPPFMAAPCFSQEKVGLFDLGVVAVYFCCCWLYYRLIALFFFKHSAANE